YTLRVDPGIRLLIPNVVTPNSDGRNDNLVASVKWLEQAQWAIYNRWGREVHRETADGLAGAEGLTLWEVPNDTEPGNYSIVVTATGLNGNTRNFGVDFMVLD
ncbi:MAG: gliding motility-associated C-terminal domain-containing protein, partial [Actinobacteria bacterium]|nr:gliding motility-associated C-terminal domain-containing protein [Actinomycetota bacterium]